MTYRLRSFDPEQGITLTDLPPGFVMVSAGPSGELYEFTQADGTLICTIPATAFLGVFVQ
ncbi:hypothetical protein D3C77_34590 [compost metagenome]